jgi:hypothetical protein
LTFLNRPAASSPTLTPAWGKCGNRVDETEEANSQIRVRWRAGAKSPEKPDLSGPAAKIASLYRYPVEGLIPEPLPHVYVDLIAGGGIAADDTVAGEEPKAV